MYKRILKAKEEAHPKISEISAMLDFIANPENPYHRWYPIFFTMLHAGLRTGEAAGLTWDDIDLENNILYIYRSLQLDENHKFKSTPPKFGPRKIIIDGSIKETLLEEKELQEKAGIRNSTNKFELNSFVFLSMDGKPYTSLALNGALKEIIKAYNQEAEKNGKYPVSELRSYDFRKAYTRQKRGMRKENL